jgi:hypothetical protein
MPDGLTRSSLALGLASTFFLTAALGCGNPPPTPMPANPAPPDKAKEQNKESRPPNPDPG